MSRIEMVECDCCGQQLLFTEWVHLPFRKRVVVGGKFWYYDLCGRSCEYDFKQWIDWSGKKIVTIQEGECQYTHTLRYSI